jgi:hypothetical protein
MLISLDHVVDLINGRGKIGGAGSVPDGIPGENLITVF